LPGWYAGTKTLGDPGDGFNSLAQSKTRAARAHVARTGVWRVRRDRRAARARGLDCASQARPE